KDVLPMLDATDRQILAILEQDGRLQWKEIGERVHMTGQAVAMRIQKMIDDGVIEGFTVRTDPAKRGLGIVFYITVYMKTNDHASFHRFLASRPEIVEAHRTSGGGCYLLKANVADHQAMNELLDAILPFGNYGVSQSIQRLK
ncbi:MAG TPA: Lrp/AsnC family transcriptional regulator, partial [Bacillota bacterium]|nr:Lrp/AsnC family transcriptional regulator [Bacillota bacterium]